MREKFLWEESYSVGVEELDNHHKHLLSLGNSIFEASTERKEKEIINGLLGELRKDAEKHFAREEELMNESGYPEYEEHTTKHKRLNAEVHLFMKQFEDDHIDSNQLASFLIDWILLHILHEDKRFQQHFNQHGYH